MQNTIQVALLQDECTYITPAAAPELQTLHHHQEQNERNGHRPVIVRNMRAVRNISSFTTHREAGNFAKVGVILHCG